MGIIQVDNIDLRHAQRPNRKVDGKWQTIDNKGNEPLKAPGCPLGCLYCNQAFLSGGKPDAYLTTTIDGGISLNTSLMRGSVKTHQISPDVLLEELRQYPFYDPNSSVILQNYTDPSLNWKESLETADQLVTKFGHTGPITLITKGKVTEKAVEAVHRIQDKGGKIVFIVTYGGLPPEIEPVPASTRIASIRKLYDNGIPTIMSMRPMIIGINAIEEIVRRVAREAGQYANAVTMGGLYVSETFMDAFAKAGYPLEELYKDGEESKIMPP